MALGGANNWSVVEKESRGNRGRRSGGVGFNKTVWVAGRVSVQFQIGDSCGEKWYPVIHDRSVS